jgi:large subunit ribosomal protein L7/L12
MMSGNVLRIALRVIVLVGAVALATKGGNDLFWLLLVPFLVWDIFRVIRPPTPSPPSAKFTEAGGYRVVLQVPGGRAIQVVKQIRETTGLGLLEAKKIVDDAPAVVAEGLSEQSAELVADQLRAAGARALAAPIGEM